MLNKGLSIEWILNNKEKYSKWSKDVEMPCKDCEIRVIWLNPYKNMVMLKDELWKEVCDEKSDLLCDKCIEKRMGRIIRLKDLKPSRVNGQNIIPCNAIWLEEKNKQYEISNN